jgi:hypothetical protein
MNQRIRTCVLAASLLALPGAALLAQEGEEAGDPQQGGRPLSTSLTGAEEIPGPGDPDGSGTAEITLNHGQGEVCWSLTVEDIGAATAAHIHRGASGVAGPVVVPLSPPTEGSSEDCAQADRELIKEILQNPDQFYVNVHNEEFPAGAVRGQLGK